MPADAQKAERLRQLQRRCGAPASGQWDLPTLEALSTRLPIPNQGNSDQRTRALQRWLGLNDDGVVGNITLDALELALWAWELPGEASPRHSLQLSRRGIIALVQYEVTSPRHYANRLACPSWPEGESGVTIGIGYDLGYRSTTQLRDDWGPQLPAAVLDRLAGACGAKGSAARALIPSLSDLRIPLEAAGRVFFHRTLPEFARLTLLAYPGTAQLPADAQAALVSLVYNRGAKLDGQRRKEMAAIVPLVAQGDLAGIAAQLRAMKRLWIDTHQPGLLARRDSEAALVEGAQRHYDNGEIVWV